MQSADLPGSNYEMNQRQQFNAVCADFNLELFLSHLMFPFLGHNLHFRQRRLTICQLLLQLSNGGLQSNEHQQDFTSGNKEIDMFRQHE